MPDIYTPCEEDTIYLPESTCDTCEAYLEMLNEKQDILIAGDNITIEDNVISSTGGTDDMYVIHIRVGDSGTNQYPHTVESYDDIYQAIAANDDKIIAVRTIYYIDDHPTGYFITATPVYVRPYFDYGDDIVLYCSYIQDDYNSINYADGTYTTIHITQQEDANGRNVVWTDEAFAVPLFFYTNFYGRTVLSANKYQYTISSDENDLLDALRVRIYYSMFVSVSIQYGATVTERMHITLDTYDYPSGKVWGKAELTDGTTITTYLLEIANNTTAYLYISTRSL